MPSVPYRRVSRLQAIDAAPVAIRFGSYGGAPRLLGAIRVGGGGAEGCTAGLGWLSLPYRRDRCPCSPRVCSRGGRKARGGVTRMEGGNDHTDAPKTLTRSSCDWGSPAHAFEHLTLPTLFMTVVLFPSLLSFLVFDRRAKGHPPRGHTVTQYVAA